MFNPFNPLDQFKNEIESATEIRWALHQSAEAEFVAKSLNNEVVATVSAPCCATALYHDGRNNFQTNYTGGSVGKLKARFVEEMKQRKAVWGTLHRESDGALIDTYKREDDTCEVSGNE